MLIFHEHAVNGIICETWVSTAASQAPEIRPRPLIPEPDVWVVCMRRIERDTSFVNTRDLSSSEPGRNGGCYAVDVGPGFVDPIGDIVDESVIVSAGNPVVSTEIM